MVETVEQAVLIGDPEQGADDRFGRREYLVLKVARIGRVIGLGDDPPVTHDDEAVEVVACAISDKLGERRRIHALLFRRRGQPSPCRPFGSIGVLRTRGPRVQNGQQSE